MALVQRAVGGVVVVFAWSGQPMSVFCPLQRGSLEARTYTIVLHLKRPVLWPNQALKCQLGGARRVPRVGISLAERPAVVVVVAKLVALALAAAVLWRGLAVVGWVEVTLGARASAGESGGWARKKPARETPIGGWRPARALWKLPGSYVPCRPVSRASVPGSGGPGFLVTR